MTGINFDLLSDKFSQYVVSPLNAFGIGGFVFDTEAESTANLSTEITDHYLEDNSAVQDHIAIRPKKIILKGYVGELVFRQDKNTNTFTQKVVQKLTTILSYLPALSQAAQQVTNFINSGQLSDFSLQNISAKDISKATDYYALLKNLATSENRQQQAYLFFKSLLEQKILVSVQTPFEFVNNMAIENVIAKQPEDSRYITDFTVILKEIRTVSIASVTIAETFGPPAPAITSVQAFAGRAGIQNQSLNQVGNMPGLPFTLKDFKDDIGLMDLKTIDEIDRFL